MSPAMQRRQGDTRTQSDRDYARTRPMKTAERTAYERELPNAFEAEKAVLGSMLLNAAAIEIAIANLPHGAGAFFWERHAQFFEFVCKLHAQGRSIDGIVIKDAMVQAGNFEAMGGFEFLTSIASTVPAHTRIVEYCEIVQRYSTLRQVIRRSHEIMSLAFDHESIEELTTVIKRALDDVESATVRTSEQTAAELVDVVARELDAEHAPDRLRTGIEAIDSHVGGLNPGEMIVLGGSTGGGKSLLAGCVADFVAHDTETPVLFCSLEMPAVDVMRRLLARRASVDSRDLRSRHGAKLTPESRERFEWARRLLKQDTLRIDECAGLDVMRLAAFIKGDVRRRGTKLVIVDYLGRIDDSDAETKRYGTAEHLYLGNRAKVLKGVALEMGVVMIVIHQYTKSEQDTNERPTKRSFYGSGKVLQETDHLWALWKPTECAIDAWNDLGSKRLITREARELCILKSRGGPITHKDRGIPLQAIEAYCDIGDVAPDHSRWSQPALAY